MIFETGDSPYRPRRRGESVDEDEEGRMKSLETVTFEQKDGVVPQVLLKLQATPLALSTELQKHLDGKAKAYGPVQRYLSSELGQVLSRAEAKRQVRGEKLLLP